MNIENLNAAHMVVTVNGLRYLTSYGSCVAKINCGQVTLGPDWNFSNTTKKFLNKFIGTTSAETRKHLESGLYLFNAQLQREFDDA